MTCNYTEKIDALKYLAEHKYKFKLRNTNCHPCFLDTNNNVVTFSGHDLLEITDVYEKERNMSDLLDLESLSIIRGNLDRVALKIHRKKRSSIDAEASVSTIWELLSEMEAVK